MLLISSLFSFSIRLFSSVDSFRRRRISSKSWQSSENSSFPSTSRTKSRLPSFIFCVAFFNLTNGTAMLRYTHSPTTKATEIRITNALINKSLAITCTLPWLSAESVMEISYTVPSLSVTACAFCACDWLNPYKVAANRSRGIRMIMVNPRMILVFSFITVLSFFFFLRKFSTASLSYEAASPDLYRL